MATVRELLAQQSVERMKEILSASPRRFREEMFNRLGIKPKKSAAGGFRLSAKGDARAKRFVEVLGTDEPVGEEVLAEVVRNFMYTRRSLLADALDFFEVPNDNGLTDKELDFLEDLEAERIQALEANLREKQHPEDDIELYLRFMNIKR